MDPKHRDRVAFFRLASGHFKRGMKLTHPRSGKQMSLHNPLFFFAQDREIAEEAWAGDIIGIPEPRLAEYRRRADRGGSHPLHRHPQLRAGGCSNVCDRTIR